VVLLGLLSTCTAVGRPGSSPAPRNGKPDPGPGPAAPATFVPRDALAAPLDAGEERYRNGLEAAGEGRWGVAAEAWASVLGAPHVLAPWATVRLAHLLLDSDPESSRRLLRHDARVLGTPWAGRREARWIDADAALRAGRTQEARRGFEALISETPSRLLATTRAWGWAEHLAASADVERRVEALRLYRRMAAGSPQRRSGRLAEERGDALYRELPAAARATVPSWTPRERLDRGRAERRRVHYDDAVAHLEASIRDFEAGGDPVGACEARLELGRTLERARRRGEAADVLEALLAAGCDDPDVLAQARFLAGRARARTGSLAAARGHYRALAAAWPDHRLADDAAINAALLAGDQGDRETERVALEEVAERFPRGDLRGEARFRAMLLALEDGDAAGALAMVEAGLLAGDPEPGEDLRGRLRYWRGRLLAGLDRRDEAVDTLVALARTHPLGYYGQRAAALLETLDPPAAKKLRAWVGEGTSWSPGGPLRVPLDGVRDDPAFQRAFALLRVGDDERGRRELAWAARRSDPADGATDGDDRQANRRLAIAALRLEAGDISGATRLLRAAFPPAPPVGANRALWRLAYPRAWSPEIEDAAATASVPPSLVRAVAREESGFAPGAVSPARAYGLLQIIRPTARPIARELGLPSGPRALQKPEVNLRIGATLLARLLERYDPHPGVVPAAYNAGPGAADRWLSERREVPFDLWVETIPYDETRRYTRRVLQSWGIYALLDEGRLPTLPSELAAR